MLKVFLIESLQLWARVQAGHYGGNHYLVLNNCIMKAQIYFTHKHKYVDSIMNTN